MNKKKTSPNIQERRIILILTGCINPNCNDILTLKDAEQRLQQYIEAINWYLKNTPYYIVFCENSGTDISMYHNFKNQNRIEILTFTSSSNTIDCSKSYKEMEIIHYVYMHSKQIETGDIFVKITGRLKLLNIVEHITYFSNHIKDTSAEYISCDMSKRHIWSDSRFFYFTQPFWGRLLSKMNLISIHYEFERALGACIIEGRKEDLTLIYPPSLQRVSGVGGGFGCTYELPDKEYKKKNLGKIFERFLFRIGLLPMPKKIFLKKWCNLEKHTY